MKNSICNATLLAAIAPIVMRLPDRFYCKLIALGIELQKLHGRFVMPLGRRIAFSACLALASASVALGFTRTVTRGSSQE
jgi:hypothetical protein